MAVEVVVEAVVGGQTHSCQSKRAILFLFTLKKKKNKRHSEYFWDIYNTVNAFPYLDSVGGQFVGFRVPENPYEQNFGVVQHG